MFGTGKIPRAIGVIFKDEKGNQHKAFISRRKSSEIILSSGAIGSPQLLILSGIGPKEELEKFNISSVVRNEFVGKGMADNPLNTIFIPSNGPVKQSLIQTVGITKMGVYIEASSGFGQSQDSIQWHHGIVSAEVSCIVIVPCQINYTFKYIALRGSSLILSCLLIQGWAAFHNSSKAQITRSN